MLFNTCLTTDDPIRQQIRDHYRIDETSIIKHLLPIADIGVATSSRAWERARQLVIEIRRNQQAKGGVDALLNEFALSTEEGIVLMCLAEALLRIPDKNTIDSLIRDKLTQGDWKAHIGNSDSIFVNASSWGLLMTGKLVNYSDQHKKQQFGLLKRIVGRIGEPVIRQAIRYAMKIMGTQFVMGRDITEALNRAQASEAKGYTYSYDMLGEGARTMADADRYFQSYQQAIADIGRVATHQDPQRNPGISIKLSAIHPRYHFSQRQRVMEEIVPRLTELALAARQQHIGLTVDAEEADRLDISLDIIAAVFLNPSLAGWEGFGMAVQAYQKRAIFVIDWIANLTQTAGRKMMVRLVKGAYWDSEIKISQTEGYPDFPVFTRKSGTDVCYQACARKLLELRQQVYPQFATHNAYTVASILEMTDDHQGFEFQRLHGMGETLYDQILESPQVPCRVYAPVGQHADLLAYLVRRLLENGANSSFVNNIVDENIPIESLLADPVETLNQYSNKHNPQIPLPRALFGPQRSNSSGLDLTDINQLTAVKTNLDAWLSNNSSSTPPTAKHQKMVNPANHDETIGYIRFDDSDSIANSINQASDSFHEWSQLPVSTRANLLLKIAEQLETHRDELIALCIKEAGKITADAVAEVREAVDFCRYYAVQAQQLDNQTSSIPRGVILCISPWNFPLAIFLGQVTAAIVTGNTVIAKPAEQTSNIALRTIELMIAAGLPQHIVNPVIAPGNLVGQIIVPDERIQGVMFTGSTATGHWIARRLAERPGETVPLIAETGGQNCMIVDSSALPEQVVDDVISSGFQSAGQRCSALRVLFLQEDIADTVITMLKGAMAELQLGDPSLLSTDIGPVIDQKALTALNKHVERLKNIATLHYQCSLPEMGDTGHYFFAPRLYEIQDLSVLTEEVFGPCVHVIRYQSDQIEQVISDINGTGFGLTMGIHTRIEAKSRYLAARSRAGNIYINRNMIGAVVGVQPFGGRGLSGTGPKAGGPLYLNQLMKEHNTITVEQLPSLNQDTPAQSVSLDLPQLDKIFNHAQAQHQLWSQTELNQRNSIIRQMLALLSDRQRDHTAVSIQAARKQLLLIENQLAEPIELPGPTGESNTLYFESRGVLICFATQDTDHQDWLVAMITALATGNTVITISDDTHQTAIDQCVVAIEQAAKTPGLLQVTPLHHANHFLNNSPISGVILSPNHPMKNAIAKTLAAREGAILPLITQSNYQGLLYRIVSEKTVTIDTTAAGGNASLMTMDDDDYH